MLDQYENALKSLGDLLPEETVVLLQKLSSKRTRVKSDRHKRAEAVGMEIDEHLMLVRPSDEKIQQHVSKATVNKVESQHAETSEALKGQVEQRRERARERVQRRLKNRESEDGGKNSSKSSTSNKQRQLSLSRLPDSVVRHPSLTSPHRDTKIRPGMSRDV